MRRPTLPAAAFGVLLAASTVPATAEVVLATDSGFVTRAEALVPAPPAAVWADLVAPAKWWDPAHTWSGQAAGLYLDPQATGCFCELLPPDPAAGPDAPRGSVEHLHIVHVVPGRLLRLTGGLGPLQAEPVGAVLTVTLTREGEGTRIAFEYRVAGLVTLKGGELAGPVDAVLGAQLARLAALRAPPATPTP